MPIAPRSLKQLFLEALAVPAPERAAWLARECAEDDDLRRQIELMLAAHDAPQSLLDRVAPPAASPPPMTERYAAESIPPGTTIGPYKLLQQIGEGGMGVVYMAEQSAPVERRVALKIIKPGMDTRQVIARFEAERQALAMMDHPNIAKVFDAGTTDSGRPYFVMELVRGIPITKYCDEHQLTLKQRLELFLPVCQAVQHAHQKGIIHRDLKPTNVLVAQYDDKPVPKVIDFGVAKAAQKLTDRTMFTEFGQVVGTLEYMSPEQARLNQLDIDTRSDIYSLGVLLYELLTGCTPFDGKRLRSAAFDEMLRIIREEEPPKPSTRLTGSDTLPSIAARRSAEPARLGRSLRGELDWIVMKALEKDRNRRYETANGFAMDVQRYLNDEQVLACPPSAVYRLRKFARKRKAALSVVGLVLLLLVLLGSSVGWAVRDRVATAQQLASERVARQTRLEQKLLQVLDEIDLHYRGGQLSEAMAAVRQAEAILSDGGIGTELDQRVRDWRHDLRMVALLEKIRLESATLSDDGKLDWSGADRAYEQAFSKYGLDFGANDVGDSAGRIAKSRIAVELAVGLDDWIDVRRRLPRTDESAWRPLLAAAQAADPDPLRNRLRSLWGRKVDEARPEIEQLAAALPDQRLHPTTVVLVARVIRGAALNAEAERVLREGQQHYPSDFWINFELASHLANQPWAKLVDAPGYYRAAVALRPANALVHTNLGFALARLSRPAEAERAHREAIRLASNYGRPHVGLGHLFETQGKWQEAIAAYEDAIRLEPDNSYPYSQLAKIQTNCPELSLRDYRRALEVAMKAAELAPNSTWEWQNLGWAEFRMGRWQAAIDALEKSCQLQNNGGKGDAFQWFFLAMANQQLGRTEEARRWYDKSFQHTEFWNDEARRIQAEAAELLGVASPPERFFESLAEARKHRDEKRWQEAIDSYSEAIKLAPIQAAATWRSRGQAYLELKQWEPAIDDVSKSLELDPESFWLWHMRGRAQAGLGQFDSAIADFTRALELNPRDVGALGHRGGAFTRLNRLDEAIVDLSKAVEIAPHRNWLWQSRAEVYVIRGAWEQVLSDYVQAVRCDPSAVGMWRRYFECCAKAKQWDQAVAECDRALSALPKAKNPWQQDAGILGVIAENDEMYNRLGKLRPADRALRIVRVKHLLRQVDLPRASSTLAEVIDLDPSDHWSWFIASTVYLDAGAAEEHHRICRAMLDRFEQTPDPFVAARTAQACFMTPGAVEELNRAQKLAQRAVAVHTSNPWFRLAQALGEYRAENFESAIKCLEPCLTQRNESPYLAEMAWLVRSMAEQKLGRPAEARNSFAKAQELIDQSPRDHVLLTEAWAENRRLDLLYQETEELLALGNSAGQAFVVQRGNPVVERRYLTLAAAVASSKDGDTIEIRGNGPFFSKPLVIGNRRLTIRAGEGFHPVVQFDANGNANQGCLLAAAAPLVLEGLELRDGGLAEPALKNPRVVYSKGAPLYVANCRFLVKNQKAINHDLGPVCQLRNCEFIGRPFLTFRCDAGQNIVIDNSIFPRSADVPMFGIWPPCKDVSIRLTRNCFQGIAAIQFYCFETSLRPTPSDPERVAPVRIESSGNIFDIFHFGSQFGFDRTDGVTPEEAKAGLRRVFDWKQHGDLFALRNAPAAKIRANQTSTERIDVAKIVSLEDWRQFWGLAEDAVIGGTMKYQGSDLYRRAESSPERIKPEDFRLHAESAGYQAGPDGKDLGPDVDLVGPGAGYERWKKTPEYQQWLQETGPKPVSDVAN